MNKSKKIKLYKKPSLFSKRYLLIGISIVFLLFVDIIAFYKFISPQPNSLIETPKNSLAKIPPDVKKMVMEQNKFASPSASVHVPILLYHYVEYVTDKRDTTRQKLNINPNTFESQIQTLLSDGYTFMTAKELGEVIDGKIQLPKKPILITFDDGHWDLDTVILPILKKYHVKATAYIIPGFLGGSDFMTQQQLQDVIQSGLVEIGAHTVHHIALKGKNFQVVTTEVGQSKTILEQDYHLSVVSFAYPAGSFDEQAINIVKAAGFSTAMSTVAGIEQSQQNRYFLYRIRAGYRTKQELLDWLLQTKYKQGNL